MDTAGASVTTTLQDKFDAVRNELQTRLIERGDIIDTMNLALVAKVHHFQLGEPGVAKSMSIRELTKLIDGFGEDDYFEILLTRFTTPEEPFGPFDLQALENGRFRRVTEGMLPSAKIAFVDEIFKANAALLNSFLWLLNERIFRNDGAVHDVPLWSVFTASNELPDTEEELNALYDRLHFRLVTTRIRENGNFVQMLQSKKIQMAGPTPKLITWDDIEQAHAEAMLVEIPTDVLDALAQVRTDLRNEGIEPTDRRFVESLRVIKAAAWLDGVATAEVEHIRPLQHMLWSTLDELPKVQRMLVELANPLDKEALDLIETLDDLGSQLDKLIREDMDRTAKNKKAVELHNRVERAKEDLVKINDKVKTANRKSAKVEEARTKLMAVTSRLLKELFNIDADPQNLV